MCQYDLFNLFAAISFSQHLLKLKTFYMKKVLFFSCVALFAISCTNNDTKDAKTGDTTKMADAKMTDNKMAVPEMPYTLSRPYQNWQMGDPQNALIVMKSLKAFENGDVATAVTAFADTTLVQFDYYHARLANDSLKKAFTKQRAEYASMVIKMDDWESVISADKKEQWVTLWYKQIMTDKKGKIDSLGVIDDAKIENGKIVLLDEKIQHYPVPKKM